VYVRDAVVPLVYTATGDGLSSALQNYHTAYPDRTERSEGHDFSCDPSGGYECDMGIPHLGGLEVHDSINALLKNEGGPNTNIMMGTVLDRGGQPMYWAAGLGDKKLWRTRAVSQALSDAYYLQQDN